MGKKKEILNQAPLKHKVTIGELLEKKYSLFYGDFRSADLNLTTDEWAKRSILVTDYANASDSKKRKMRTKLIKVLGHSAFLQDGTQIRFYNLPGFEREILLSAPHDMLNDAIKDEASKRAARDKRISENRLKVLTNDNKDDDDDEYELYGYHDAAGNYHPYSYSRKDRYTRRGRDLSLKSPSLKSPSLKSPSTASANSNYGSTGGSNNYGRSDYSYSYYGGRYNMPHLKNFKYAYAVRQVSLYNKSMEEISKMKYFSKTPHIPLILVPTPIRNKMWELVKQSEIEVSWHCLVRRMSEEETVDRQKAMGYVEPSPVTDVYIMEDILMFPQTNSAATTTTDDGDYQQWMDKLPDEQFNMVRCHCHSHVNMGCTPSGPDQQYRDNIMSQVTRPDDFYLFMILNKQRKFTLSLFVLADSCEYEEKDVVVYAGTLEEWIDSMVDTSELEINKVLTKIACISKTAKLYEEPGPGATAIAPPISILKTVVEDAEKAYNELCKNNGKDPKNQDLIPAESVEAIEAGKKYVKSIEEKDKSIYCITKINGIPESDNPEYLYKYVDVIDDARKVYTTLPEEIKQFVTNYEALVRAEEKVAIKRDAVASELKAAEDWAKDQIDVNVTKYNAARAAAKGLTIVSAKTADPAPSGTTPNGNANQYPFGSEAGADTGACPTTTPTPQGTTTTSTTGTTKETSVTPATSATLLIGGKTTHLPYESITFPELLESIFATLHTYGSKKDLEYESILKSFFNKRESSVPIIGTDPIEEIMNSCSITDELIFSKEYAALFIDFVDYSTIPEAKINEACKKAINILTKQYDPSSSMTESKKNLFALKAMLQSLGIDRVRSLSSDMYSEVLEASRNNRFFPIQEKTFLSSSFEGDYAPKGIIVNKVPLYFNPQTLDTDPKLESIRAQNIIKRNDERGTEVILGRGQAVRRIPFNVLYTDWFHLFNM